MRALPTLLLLLAAPAAVAQPLQHVVIGTEAAVGIAPRGLPLAVPPAPALGPAPLPAPAAGGGLLGALGLGGGLASTLAPLAAAAVLGGALPGSGGGGSGPARTR
jgi:hypothetical protein